MADRHRYAAIAPSIFVGVMLTIVAGMVVVHPVQGAIAYLASIGPAPIRFELVTDADVTLNWKPLRLALQPAQKAAIPTPDSKTMTNVTNDAGLKLLSSSATNDTIIVSSASAANPGEKNNSDMSPGSVMLPGQTDDSSSPVTPQILAGFFKPAPGGKNPGGKNSTGAALFMPAEIGFTPPSAKPATESRATYIIQ